MPSTTSQCFTVGFLPTSPPRYDESSSAFNSSSLGRLFAETCCTLWFDSNVEESKHGFPTERFLSFSNLLLQTTFCWSKCCDQFGAKFLILHVSSQVSHSVIILALLYIQRLKARNPNISGAHGSEFRLAVVSLMLANKVLDDNTYTAQTWAEVSSLDLAPLVAGEAEFLRGLDFNLHCTQSDFVEWQSSLKLGSTKRSIQYSGQKIITASGNAPVKRPRTEIEFKRNDNFIGDFIDHKTMAPTSKPFALAPSKIATARAHDRPSIPRQLRPRALNLLTSIPPPVHSSNSAIPLHNAHPPSTRSSQKRTANSTVDSIAPPPKRSNAYPVVPFPYPELSPSFTPSQYYGSTVKFQHLSGPIASPTVSVEFRPSFSSLGSQKPFDYPCYSGGTNSSIPLLSRPPTFNQYSPAGSILQSNHQSKISFSTYSNAGLPAVACIPRARYVSADFSSNRGNYH